MDTYCEPLQIPTHLQGKAGLRKHQKSFFSEGLTARAQCLLAQIKARGIVPEDVWGPSPERRALAKAVAETARDWMEWPNANFVPEDPFELVVFPYLSDSNIDGMELCGFLMDIEELLGRELDPQFVDLHQAMTFGEAVDYLLERCADGTVTSNWLPANGDQAPESRHCPALATFLDLRTYLSRPLHGVYGRAVRPSASIRRELSTHTRCCLRSYVLRRFGVNWVLEDWTELWDYVFLGLLATALPVLIFGILAVVGIIYVGDGDWSPLGLPLGIAAIGLSLTAVPVALYLVAKLYRRLRQGKRVTLRTFGDLVRWVLSERARLASGQLSRV